MNPIQDSTRKMASRSSEQTGDHHQHNHVIQLDKIDWQLTAVSHQCQRAHNNSSISTSADRAITSAKQWSHAMGGGDGGLGGASLGGSGGRLSWCRGGQLANDPGRCLCSKPFSPVVTTFLDLCSLTDM